MLILSIVLSVFASVSFLYFYWKKLKDDYSQSQVFSTGFYNLFGLGIGYFISNLYFPKFWFWGTILTSFLFLLLGMRKFKMRFFESLEAWVLGNFSVLFFFEIYSLSNNVSLFELVNLASVLLLIGLFFYISKRYKRYVWYRSGKVGFSGLLTAGLYFVFRASNLLFSGIMDKVVIWDLVISAIWGFVSFVTLYNLSKKEI